MTIVGTIEHVPSLIGAYNTTQLTPANSPWQLNLLGIALLIVGLALAKKITSNG